MDNKNNSSELEYRTRVDSTASSDSHQSDNIDDLDECLESIFEWFAQKNIVKGNPEQNYEEHIKRKREGLKASPLLASANPLASNLLRRRLASQK